MYSAFDANKIDYVPVKNLNRQWVIFFIVFIIVGSFFMLNLFVGVVISTYHREKDKLAGNNLLSHP